MDIQFLQAVKNVHLDTLNKETLLEIMSTFKRLTKQMKIDYSKDDPNLKGVLPVIWEKIFGCCSITSREYISHNV